MFILFLRPQRKTEWCGSGKRNLVEVSVLLLWKDYRKKFRPHFNKAKDIAVQRDYLSGNSLHKNRKTSSSNTKSWATSTTKRSHCEDQ